MKNDPNKMKELFKFYQKKEQLIEIYSTEGIFYIYPKQMFKMKHYDVPSQHFDDFIGTGLSVIIDKTKIVHEIVYQIPVEHVYTFIKKHHICFDNNMPLKLIVEEICDENNILNEDILTNIPLQDNISYIYLPDDIDIQENSVKKKLNELLFYFY
jgi:hypothetical protein